jgi:hypothetical protein
MALAMCLEEETKPDRVTTPAVVFTEMLSAEKSQGSKLFGAVVER